MMHIHICGVQGLGIVKHTLEADDEKPERDVYSLRLYGKDDTNPDSGITIGEFVKTDLLGFLNEAETKLLEEDAAARRGGA
jgi:hypothetical protein